MMETRRLTYSDFQHALLFKFVVLAEADFERPMDMNDVALTVAGKFQQSWVSAVTQKFVEKRYIRKWQRPIDEIVGVLSSEEPLANKMRRMSQWGEIHVDYYVLTENGLEEAERIAEFEAWNLWRDIDEVAEEGFASLVIERGRQVKLDRGSPDFQEVETGLNTAIEELRADNMLMSEAEGGQRLAELEAGKALIQAEQVNESLIKRVLLPSLTWTAKKIRDEGAVAIIKIGVAKLLAMLSG